MLKRLIPAVLVCAAAGSWSFVVSGQQRGAARPTTSIANEWPTYGHDPGGMRYSPVSQVTPVNVGQLQLAWVYHMNPPAPAGAAATSADTSAAGPPQGRGGRGSASGFSSG